MGRSEVVMNFEITKGKIKKPYKVVVYGPEGIGKSTFASHFPDPLFIDTEGSTRSLDIKRLPKPTSYEMFKQEIDYIIQNNTSICRTLVIDSIDWGESLIVQDICNKYQKKGIEDFGYGNGYVYTKEEVGRLLNRLENVIESGVNVVLTAHAQIRKFEKPDESGAFDRYELKLGKKTASQTAPLVKEWADMVLFANYQTFVSKDEKGKTKVSGNRRVMYTVHNACWDAKNRDGLPEMCDFDYKVIKPIIEEPLNNVSSAPVNEKPQTQVNVPVEPKEPQIEENKPVSAIDFNSEEYQKIPSKVRDLMKCDSISIEKLKEVIFLKGFFPKDTPIENMPNDFWEFIASSCSNLKDFIIESEIQF